MENNSKYVDAIIFDVVDKFGEKIVHILADSYNSYDGTETPYRFVEYCWAYVALADIPVNAIWGYDLLQHKQYIEDCSLDSLNDIYEHYCKTASVICGGIPDDISVGSYILLRGDSN